MRLSELVTRANGVDEPNDAPLQGTCRICGLDGSGYPVDGTDGVFSDAFTSSDALDDGDHVCWRCKHLAGWQDFRRYHWVADGSGVEIITERPRLIERLLEPPDGPWMAQYKDGSDFLTILNGWVYAQALNTSAQRFRLLVDKELVDVERARLAEMIAFGRDLRARDDAPSKRALKAGVTAGDLARYDVSRDEAKRIRDEYAGRDDWRVAVQLID